MRGKIVWSLIVTCGLVPAFAGAGPAPSQDLQAALGRDVDAMSARVGRANAQQAAADAERIAAGYRALGPGAARFGPADYAANRLMARRSLEWLGRASTLYGRDPLVARAILSGYDSIGLFYRDYGRFYAPGAFVAYAGAARLSRRLALDARYSAFERDMDRYAYAYGAYAVAQGALLMPWNVPGDLPDTDSVPAAPAVTLKPVDLPALDTSGLSADQRSAYLEVRDHFRIVAPRVHQARVLLQELTARLQRQRMTLNPEDAANALKMQGYVEDAAALVGEQRFDLAEAALTKADYVRGKLRGVTGQ